ncbi:B-cell receptor CD22 [Bombina bombina]|uniref:B-cell receptor CD22 n=1 Tax=Bombina bombina TaxID=8345 RepID=UPI00235B2CF8|nr:B-cell receptor CD22 [Bombina bombina]
MKCVGILALVALFCVVSAQYDFPQIQIAGPLSPVDEGEDVTLECLSDFDSDLEHYTFQKYSKWMKTWFDVGAGHYFRCWYYNLNVSREDGRLLLHLSDITEWQSGPYRCVYYGNESREFSASNNFSVPVYYLRDIYLERLKGWSTTVPDIVYVEEGDDVQIKCSVSSSQQPIYEWNLENSDWILPSDTLVLKKVSQVVDSGKYTCKAFNPENKLSKEKSFELLVAPKSAEVKFGGLGLAQNEILLYFIAPALTLLLPLLFLIIIIIRKRRSQMRKPQISLIDSEKRSPIYKGSAESVYTNTADTQPLVM